MKVLTQIHMGVPARASLLLIVALVLRTEAAVQAQTAHTLPVTIAGDHFERGGEPYQIISGAIHYVRVPRADWRDRLEKARAMGLNTVETYVFWNLHEPRPGVFDFSGQLDVAAFVRMAQQQGLNVILRPGPYICAEWDAGGLPAWLFADPALKVRSSDPRFLAAADRYLARLGKELSGLQAAHGGPIIAVQIENEYGSYGNDKTYVEAIHQSLIRAGLGDSIFYTANGVTLMDNGDLPGVMAVINFGPGSAKSDFEMLSRKQPDFPRMSGEYWDGWFDAWGNAEHAHTNATAQAKEVAWMLDQGYSLNLYMFEGGTTFGFMNGANWQPGDHYKPQTTSYDYDAPLDEAGRPTAKFFLLRDVIVSHTHTTAMPLPPPQPLTAMPEFALTDSAPLWDNLPAAVRSKTPRSMEELGQSYGYILYRAHVPALRQARLKLENVHDYAAIYLNRKFVGVIDRRLDQSELTIDVPAGGATLDILVENTGRVNYGPHLSEGRAGLYGNVLLSGKEPRDWEIFPLPMESPDTIKHWKEGAAVSGPAFHRGVLQVVKPADTFLDVSHLGKGFVWVNGHNLGRVWNIGPQHSLYLPAAWLRQGSNEVVVFDFMDLDQPRLRGLDGPRWQKAEAKPAPGAPN